MAKKFQLKERDTNEDIYPITVKEAVGLGNVDNTSDANKPVSTAQATAIADAKKELKAELLGDVDSKLVTKVDKVEGKGLSTNDYTNNEKSKLSTLPTATELDALFTAKQDKLINSADVTVGEDDKLSVTEEAKRKAFIDQWNTACTSGAIRYGSYNEKTGYFELNGLTDISYEQALDINRQSEIYSDSNVCGVYTSRTLYPIRSNATGWFTVSFNAKFVSSALEAIRFSFPPTLRASAASMFAYCSKLRVIHGVLTLASPNQNNVASMFLLCSELREVQLKSLQTSISFSDSPLLSLDSISYMVTNAANTSPITITLHPDAYARLTDELIAQATEKQITFATPT